MKHSSDVRWLVCDAISALGLFNVGAVGRLVEAMEAAICVGENPLSVALRLRSSGRLLALAEKKALGINGRLKISHEAFGMLTDEGKLDPKLAYERTVLRVMLLKLRSDRLEADYSSGVREWTAHMPFPDTCSGCRRWQERVFRYEEISLAGPDDCLRDTCALSLSGRWQSMASH